MIKRVHARGLGTLLVGFFVLVLLSELKPLTDAYDQSVAGLCCGLSLHGQSHVDKPLFCPKRDKEQNVVISLSGNKSEYFRFKMAAI